MSPCVGEDEAGQLEVHAHDVDDRPHGVEELTLVFGLEPLERRPHYGAVLELAGARQPVEQEGRHYYQRRDEPRRIVPRRALGEELAPVANVVVVLHVEPEDEGDGQHDLEQSGRHAQQHGRAQQATHSFVAHGTHHSHEE